MKFSASSTLVMQTNYDIETMSSGIWWDRANVSIYENNNNNYINPDGGRLYNATVAPEYTGCNTAGEGWASLDDTWPQSTWSNSTLADFEGAPIQLSVIYATDRALVERGFWVDAITITDVLVQVPDDQSNMCVLDLIFANGFDSNDIVDLIFMNGFE